MKSIRELYRTGHGPSSSHTMAPRRAAEAFGRAAPEACSFRVTLFGSLAATGRAHFTDRALEEAFAPRKVSLVFEPDRTLAIHPLGMRLEALDADGRVVLSRETASLGGGALLEDAASPETYPLSTMAAILGRILERGESFWEYVGACEGEGVWEFLDGVWRTMEATIARGLAADGVLPGGLGLARKAHSLHRKSLTLAHAYRRDGLLAAFAHAVAEENAAGGVVVAAPTCGSAGVLPAVLFYLREDLGCGRQDVLRALAAAGLVGNLVKHNASISGAVVGCQGEVGTACAMAAAAATQLFGGTPRQIEYAAEMGLEHHLGLTCDPVDGFVQIPCIERNAHAAARAVSGCHFALLSDGLHRIGFDDVVAAMLETGQALPALYRETSGGGLARFHPQAPRDGSA